ncbi:hypothetical protein LUZ63_013593 [Rhynchospora breviuscula]|uniref:glucan endo-1,3-beta-D-glucosidase n=1 Tax=Rhynchospora breviuscula TaxID=2022672 RepID=A0A9Q0C8V1_9POAL|nr:hypothetical protein LUZ63_013593 [Rhynchospora breviuscula]
MANCIVHVTFFLLTCYCLSAASVPQNAHTAGLGQLGVNWGTMTSHPINPTIIVDMLRANGIRKVKLFDANPWTMTALGGTHIETMVAIPNDQLSQISTDYNYAKKWISNNITRYYYDHKVKIRYVAVGNEPFLKSYNNLYINSTFPALRNIQKALDEAGLGTVIKATVPLNADVYNSPNNNPVPSAGEFRVDIRQIMHKIVHYLNHTGAPFVVNIYPFLSLYQNPHFPIDFAFFNGTNKPIIDKGVKYTNVFDANFDMLVWSLKKAGVPNLKIIVGEVGWPTDGDKNANIQNARRFYDGFLRKIANKTGTPKRPGGMEVYLFGLIDENQKSILPGNFERNWGLFTYDGRPKFAMDLTGTGKDQYLVGAKGVEHLPAQWCVSKKEAEERYYELSNSINYACQMTDCTALGYNSSCNGLSLLGNASYAFNMYFQMHDQDVRACNFNGLAIITEENPSTDKCLFPVQIISESQRKEAGVYGVPLLVLLISLLYHLLV